MQPEKSENQVMSAGAGRYCFGRCVAGVALAAIFWSAGVLPALADEDLDEGVLLVADRKLKDPNFERTVVLIVSYDEEGTVGLVVNRQSDVPVSALLAGVKDARSHSEPAFSGGPVEPKSVLALLRSHTAPKGGQRVGPDIWAILDQDLLEQTLATHPTADKLRFYVGYAGWGPGQLESEMEAGAWHVMRSTPDTVFDATPESLWDRVVRTLDSKVARVWGPLRPLATR